MSTYFWMMLRRCFASTRKESSMSTMAFSWWTRASILETDEKMSSAGASSVRAQDVPPNQNTSTHEAAITNNFISIFSWSKKFTQINWFELQNSLKSHSLRNITYLLLREDQERQTVRAASLKAGLRLNVRQKTTATIQTWNTPFTNRISNSSSRLAACVSTFDYVIRRIVLDVSQVKQNSCIALFLLLKHSLTTDKSVKNTEKKLSPVRSGYRFRCGSH